MKGSWTEELGSGAPCTSSSLLLRSRTFEGSCSDLKDFKDATRFLKAIWRSTRPFSCCVFSWILSRLQSGGSCSAPVHRDLLRLVVLLAAVNAVVVAVTAQIRSISTKFVVTRCVTAALSLEREPLLTVPFRQFCPALPALLPGPTLQTEPTRRMLTRY